MLYERCGNGNLSTAASKNAGTLGCGACLEAPYCFSKADNAAQEWIASVSLGSWLHESGAAGNGYQLFTSDLISPPFVQIGKPANIQITPGFMGQPKFEHFRVFIDWNQDGDFEDAQELAFDPGFAINQACSGQILAPEFAMPGLTRMRISMKMKNNFSQPAEPCEYFQFGQVEDYCLRVAENNATSTGAPTTDKALFIWPSPADNQIWVKLPVVSDISFVIKDLSGRFIRSGVPDSAMGIALEGITAGVYLLEIFTADRHYAQLFVKQ